MQEQSKTYKRIGTVSFNDNKVRISYDNGSESVLFEDISSIGYRELKGGNVYVFLAGLVIATISFLILLFYQQYILSVFVFLILFVLSSILSFVFFMLKWDNIQIETKGGKILEYSVPEGKGKDQMELIESKKREILGM